MGDKQRYVCTLVFVMVSSLQTTDDLFSLFNWTKRSPYCLTFSEGQYCTHCS